MDPRPHYCISPHGLCYRLGDVAQRKTKPHSGWFVCRRRWHRTGVIARRLRSRDALRDRSGCRARAESSLQRPRRTRHSETSIVSQRGSNRCRLSLPGSESSRPYCRHRRRPIWARHRSVQAIAIAHQWAALVSAGERALHAAVAARPGHALLGRSARAAWLHVGISSGGHKGLRNPAAANARAARGFAHRGPSRRVVRAGCWRRSTCLFRRSDVRLLLDGRSARPWLGSGCTSDPQGRFQHWHPFAARHMGSPRWVYHHSAHCGRRTPSGFQRRLDCPSRGGVWYPQRSSVETSR